MTYFLSAGDLGTGDLGTGDRDRPPPVPVGDGVLRELSTVQRGEALTVAGVWFLTSLLALTNTPLRGSHWKYLVPFTDPSFLPTGSSGNHKVIDWCYEKFQLLNSNGAWHFLTKHNVIFTLQSLTISLARVCHIPQISGISANKFFDRFSGRQIFRAPGQVEWQHS